MFVGVFHVSVLWMISLISREWNWILIKSSLCPLRTNSEEMFTVIQVANDQLAFEQGKFLPPWHLEQHGIRRFLHGHRPFAQVLLHLHAVIVRYFVYVWDAWIIEISGRVEGSMFLNSVDVVCVKSIKSAEVNAVEMIPSADAREYLFWWLFGLDAMRIILHGNIEGAVFDRSTLAIFTPTMSPIWNVFCFLRAWVSMPFCRSM